MSGAVTEGPWRVEGPADFPNPNMGMWDVEGLTNICTHCTLYDARLIASAPELYSALKDMIRLADMGLEESLREPEENGNFAAYNRAVAALRKADGL